MNRQERFQLINLARTTGVVLARRWAPILAMSVLWAASLFGVMQLQAPLDGNVSWRPARMVIDWTITQLPLALFLAAIVTLSLEGARRERFNALTTVRRIGAALAVIVLAEVLFSGPATAVHPLLPADMPWSLVWNGLILAVQIIVAAFVGMTVPAAIDRGLGPLAAARWSLVLTHRRRWLLGGLMVAGLVVASLVGIGAALMIQGWMITTDWFVTYGRYAFLPLSLLVGLFPVLMAATYLELLRLHNASAPASVAETFD